MTVAAVCAGGAFAPGALGTTLPFSTGFEAAQGYTNGSQLASVSDWTGDGQDSTGWLITNSVVGGSGASTGSQWVLASGATATATKFQWTVTPVTDFSSQPAIIGSADVKLASPASGSATKSTAAGLQMYDAALNLIGAIEIIIDTENLAGLGVNQALLEIDFGDGSGVLYDLGVNNLLNTYVNLGLAADFSTGTIYGFLNGVQAPDTGPTGGATDFHDFDLFLGAVSGGVGTRARAGFDNYSIAQGFVPEPGAVSLLVIAAGLLARRGR